MNMFRIPLLLILCSLLFVSCSTKTTQIKTVKNRTLSNVLEISQTKNIEELQFILAYYDTLILEISRGKGIHLEKYSNLLGISQVDKKLFFNEIQKNSDYLSRQEFPYTLYKELRNTLAKNKKFSHLNIIL